MITWFLDYAHIHKMVSALNTHTHTHARVRTHNTSIFQMLSCRTTGLHTAKINKKILLHY